MDSINEITRRLRENRRLAEAKIDYEEADDKELAKAAKRGDQQAFEVLLKRYDYFIYKMTKKYIMDNQDSEDVKQLAQIGLWNAVKKWDGTGSFEAYAGMTIKNNLVDALRTDSTERNKFNTSASSLDEPVAGDEDGESSVVDDTPSKDLSPEEEYLGKEGADDLFNFMREKLSQQERDVINWYIKGYKVSDIEKETGMGYKKIENTLMRVKNKVADYMRAKGNFNESRSARREKAIEFSDEEKKVLESVINKVNIQESKELLESNGYEVTKKD